MTPSDHAVYERLMADALCAADPVAAVEGYVADDALSPELRALFAHVDARGLRISALMVVRLRFERLLHGSRTAADDFERDPRSFTERFRAYHHAVPPTALDPRAEARTFEAWSAT